MPVDFDPVERVDCQERDRHDRSNPPREAGRLHSVVVSYADEPDQRTVFPADTTGYDRTTTWFTANAKAFVDLVGER